MNIPLDAPWIQTLRLVLEVAATVAFALSGVMAAARKRLDAVGVCVVAFVAAFGGGTLRDLLLAADALRRPVRLTVLRQACEADRNSRPGRAQDGDRPGEWIARALEVVRGVNAGAIARSVPAPKVERAIRDARLKALRAWRARALGGLLLE